jgi:GNAT superfamily N-acetyltransferase
MRPAISTNSDYLITRARRRDLSLINDIESAAATLLRGLAPDAVLDEITSQQDLREAQQDGRLWVALSGDHPVGFAHVELIEWRVAHLKELDVHPDHGRRGVGTRLVAEVCRWAQRHEYLAVTLTTFRKVPWNMPFYSRMGFEEIPKAQLSQALEAVLRDEARRGLALAQRVAMQRRVGRHTREQVDTRL